MAFMTTTMATTSFCFSPTHQPQRAFPRKENDFVYFNLFRKPSLSSCSSVTVTRTSIRASTLLSRTITRERTDCNSEICRFCEVGNLKKAMELLCDSPESKLESRTFCSILQLCAEYKSLEVGKKVHSIVNTSGVFVDGLLGTKLVFMYMTCGDLKEGRRIFDEIQNEKVFLWNLVMNEYAKVRNFKETVYLYKRMRRLGIEPNTHTFTCILKCYAALGNVAEGQEAHGYLLKMGYGSYTNVANALIGFYSKCKRIDSARDVFDELCDRDVISWNSIIGGYVTNGYSNQGLEVFSEMRYSGTSVDIVTMISVLQACAEMGILSYGCAIHSFVIKSRSFNQEITLHNTLLDMYAKCGDLSSAIRVFRKMGKKSVVSWTSMIMGYTREGQYDKAIEIFQQMEGEGIKPDLFTVTSMLHACACSKAVENGRNIHDYIMRNDLQNNTYVANALMDMFAKCGSMAEARSVFYQMPVKDAISWNTMIGGYSKNNLPNEALGLFIEMQLEFDPNGVTIACVLPACASLSALERGREIHGSALRTGYFSDRHVNNALVDMYAKCGALPLARLLFDRMQVKDLFSWTVMIAGYGMHGYGRDAIAMFNEMKNTGIEPDEISFIALLYACSHSGLLDEGWRFFHIMSHEYKIVPTLEHYACMVDLFARAGRLTKAYKFIKAMPIEADATVWGALLCGCRVHRDVKLAEEVAERVFELEPENTGYYVLLANIYAEAEKWEEVKKLRERIGRRGLRKNPGCSWIEIKDKFHIFFAQTRTHPEAKRIELFLERVRLKMKEEGCHPRKRYALVNASEMEKEVALCGHSEKLAMAFGILSLPPGKTVRVTKNLRVCGDCHETAAFMSKMVGKEIVLRDSNRFHHFSDGRCSCRGYW